jgi:hypothetical protein
MPLQQSTMMSPPIPTKRLVHPLRLPDCSKVWMKKWQTFANSVTGPSSLGPHFLQIRLSWALDGHIARKLTRMEHSRGTAVVSLPKDFPKFSESITSNPSRPLLPSLLFARFFFSAVLDTLPNVPECDRIYKDCPYESCIIILCSYVDDILVFTNCQSLADDFLAHCNKRFTMTCDGEAHWYLSVKYTREASGAISASQELCINKILKRWGMESCKPLPTPFPAKTSPSRLLTLFSTNNFRKSSVNSCTVNNRQSLKLAGPYLS